MQFFLSADNRFRLFFAVQFASIGIFAPYIALYFTSINLSGPQIGLLLALIPFVAFLVQPLWGIATDIYRQHRLALIFACLGDAAVIMGLSLSQSFGFILLFIILYALLMAPISILVTALALEHLVREPTKTSFGSLRLWGSIGFAITSFGVGALFVDNEAIRWILPLTALCNVLLALIAWTFPDATIHDQVSWREGIALIQSEGRLIWFLIGMLLIGMTIGIVNSYLSVYLKDIQATGWIIGVALAISAIFEVPLMAQVPKFIRRWGIRLVLIVGTAMLPIRWLLYSIIEDPLVVLPFQLLHSIALTSLLIVGVLYVDRIMEPKWRTSGQSLYAASLFGIGPGLGLYIAGILYGWNGIKSVWLFCTIAALLGTIILVYAVYWHPDPEVVEVNG